MRKLLIIWLVIASAAIASVPAMSADHQNSWIAQNYWWFDDAASVPEMDAASATLAFFILAGLITIGRERRKKKSD